MQWEKDSINSYNKKIAETKKAWKQKNQITVMGLKSTTT